MTISGHVRSCTGQSVLNGRRSCRLRAETHTECSSVSARCHVGKRSFAGTGHRNSSSQLIFGSRCLTTHVGNQSARKPSNRSFSAQARSKLRRQREMPAAVLSFVHSAASAIAAVAGYQGKVVRARGWGPGQNWRFARGPGPCSLDHRHDFPMDRCRAHGALCLTRRVSLRE